jgi:hypothetical protein
MARGIEKSAQSASPPALARSGWHKLRRLFVMVLVIYVGVCVLMMFFERSLVYFPMKYPNGYWKPIGLNFEDAYFQAADGTKLHGWYVPHEKPRAVLLLAHGNGGNLTHRAELLEILHDRIGVSSMIFDYRGYGRSEGAPDEAGIMADGRAARKWLAQRAGVKETDIVMVGESLGGAVAVDLAAKDGARGLVLLNTFSSAPDVAAAHYPWLPVRLLMRTQLNSAAIIGNYHGPLLQTHGDHDRIAPLASARKLFDAANEPKQFILNPGGDHNDDLARAFWPALDKFIAELKPAEK